MKRKQIFFILTLSLITFFSAKAQQKYYLNIYYNQKPSYNSISINRKEPFRDSLSAVKALDEYITEWRDHGFLQATLDSSYIHLDTIRAYVTIGEKYKWLKLSKGNINSNFLNEVGFKEKFYSNKDFSIEEYQRLENRIITFAENRGYPFAAIKLDSIDIHNSEVKASLNFNTGPLIQFDSLTINGNAKIHPKFISRYFRINRGILFNRSKVAEADKALSEFSSIRITRPPSIIFSNYKAYPIFYLNHRPANIIDGIIGFLPNENSKKLLVTGQLTLHLYNIGGVGKDLLLEWNKLKPLSQLMNLQFNNLNLLNTGLDIEGRFNLLKEDTSFVNIITRLTISRLLARNAGRVKLFSEYKNSRTNVQSEDSIANRAISDFNLVSYGIGYLWQKLDDIVYPRKGFKFSIDALVGNKSIKPSSVLDSLYKTEIPERALQSSITGNIQLHTRLSSKSGFYNSFSAGGIQGDQLFINDLFRLGGLKTIRGFNENIFFASKYIIFNMEYRYFYEPESYLILFYDQAYLQTKFIGQYRQDFPLGVGGGITFKTNVGTLQVLYSLGKSRDQIFSFIYSKIHFGLTNRF